ncbi:DUF4190 domain-containing protein [Candidatus Laterigemmans baculatus]|uniref:DUF4190 domain-containing protein n=1 Tax=Candidatus Laterigemmans baculatus TaxID=2770505 RepID=UPI0013DC52E8|nr:DUF4190 domain-containing protein [Candidatus Laterigemmans baculatus]
MHDPQTHDLQTNRPQTTSPQNPYLASDTAPPPHATQHASTQHSQAQYSPAGFGQPPREMGDATGGLIPYKNPKALISYYLGIVSLLPVIGFPLGVASIILGIGGLRARRQTPIIKGSAHAIIGIVLGLCGMPLHLLFGMGIAIALGSAVFGS